MAPEAPVHVNVKTTEEGYLEVSWDENAEGDRAIYYHVYRGPRRLFVLDEGSLIGQPVHTSYTDMYTTASTYYYYRIVAVNGKHEEGQPSESVVGRGSLDKIVKSVIKSCLIGILILSVLFYVYDGMIFDKNLYVISFAGNPTFDDDTLSGIADNTNTTLNNTNTNRIVTIYGLNNVINMSVYSSHLTNIDANTIIPVGASLVNMSQTEKTKSGNASQIRFNIDTKDVKRGSFDGLLSIQGGLYSIPIRLATETMLIQSVIITFVGILISIILWELIKFMKKNNAEQERQNLFDKSRRALSKANHYLHVFNRNEVELRSLSYQVEALARGLNDAQTRADFESMAIRKNNLEKNSARFKSMETSARAASEVYNQQAATMAEKVESYNIRNLHRRTTYGKIIITEIGSALFGISVAVFGLLTNDYVLGLRYIGPIELVVLIGLGLGIGSLKEIVDK